MGKQSSVIQVGGTVGNVCFYRTSQGYFVRSKGGVSKSRIKNHPNFARVRENNAEFKRAAGAGRVFREAFGSLVQRVGGKGLANRVMKIMMQAIKADGLNTRGERTVKDGVPSLFQGFEFNEHCALQNVMRAPFSITIDRTTGVMTVGLEAFSPVNAITAPEGATHFRLFAGGAAVDFEGETYKTAMSESAYLPVGGKRAGPIQLEQKVGEGSSSLLLLVLGVEFLQLVNGKVIRMRNVVVNAMSLVGVE